MPAVSSRQAGGAPPAPPGRTAAVRVPTVVRVAGPSRIPAWVPVGDPSRFFSNPAVRETDQHRSLRETLIRPPPAKPRRLPQADSMLEGELHVGGVDVSFLTRPGRGPQRIGSRQHRCPERVRRAATPLDERTRAMEGSTRQPSDLESTAGRRAWDPDGFDGPPHWSWPDSVARSTLVRVRYRSGVVPWVGGLRDEPRPSLGAVIVRLDISVTGGACRDPSASQM